MKIKAQHVRPGDTIRVASGWGRRRRVWLTVYSASRADQWPLEGDERSIRLEYADSRRADRPQHWFRSEEIVKARKMSRQELTLRMLAA